MTKEKEVNLVVKCNIKKVVNMNVSENVASALNRKIKQILKEAEERAKANQRKTLLARDI